MFVPVDSRPQTYDFIKQIKSGLNFRTRLLLLEDNQNFISFKSNKYKIVLNVLVNRFYALKECIVLDDLNLSMPVFKKLKLNSSQTLFV
jgi:hypothetical protein